jgi:hypothetical protein
MALGDYILCCKCEVKLIYDGDRGNRDWWVERFGAKPEIMCPDCEKEKTFVGLTDEEHTQIVVEASGWNNPTSGFFSVARAIEAKLKEKNT